MNVLVTGSNGFIARTLIDNLLDQGHKVFGLDVVETPNHWNSKNFHPLVADISNSRYIDPDFGTVWWSDIDFVFHLAAMANVDDVRVNREKAFQVNLHGTFNIIEACRKGNIPLAFASTACVYGQTTQCPSTEDGPTVPVDWYGVTKRAGEELVKGLLKKYVILRFGTTFGPEMREALCTSIFLKQAIKEEKFTVKGSGEQSRNFIYVDDLVTGCIKAMRFLMDGGSNEIFNLVGINSYTIHQLASICYQTVHNRPSSNIKKHITYLSWRPEDILKEDVSIEKSVRMLEWIPQVTLECGIGIIYDKWINAKSSTKPDIDQIGVPFSKGVRKLTYEEQKKLR